MSTLRVPGKSLQCAYTGWAKTGLFLEVWNWNVYDIGVCELFNEMRAKNERHR